MKYTIFALLAVISFSFTACKKCSTCITTADQYYAFTTGDATVVVSTPVVYGEVEYAVGDAITFTEDATLVYDGLRFEGAGTVELKNSFCGKGAPYQDQLHQHEKAGWVCTSVKKKDVKDDL